MSADTLPTVVIGAGPVGLAAAAHLTVREQPVVVLESGARAGSAVTEWGHVRLFSPWSELVDPAARTLLERSGWTAPEPGAHPTGAEWATDHLQPLAELLGVVRFRHRVTAVTRTDRDRLVTSGRDDASFTLHVDGPDGPHHVLAAAVIDASGTWSTPSPLGGDGVAALGEREASARISHRIPDLGDAAVRARYAGRHVVVAGTGASAKGALIGLRGLADVGTRVSWLVRRADTGAAFAGSEQDELPERGALGRRAAAAVRDGAVSTHHGFRTAAVTVQPDGRLRIRSFAGQEVGDVDEVLALTGFRPDLGMLSELRLDLDPVLQAPRRLAPLVDPNEHSCGTVEPHGANVLVHPETGFFLVGAKSYGRATSFLALTGFEQARSVVAAIAGDHEAAARVELRLPETGVCGGSGSFDATESGGGCCSAPSGPQPLVLGRPGA